MALLPLRASYAGYCGMIRDATIIASDTSSSALWWRTTLDSKVARLRAPLRHPTPIVAGTARSLARPSPNPRDGRPWAPQAPAKSSPGTQSRLPPV